MRKPRLRELSISLKFAELKTNFSLLLFNSSPSPLAELPKLS